MSKTSPTLRAWCAVLVVAVLLPLGGCGSSRFLSRGVLIPAKGGYGSFLDAERLVYLYGWRTDVSAWDLGAGRMAWTRTFERASWLLPSSSRQYLAVVQGERPGPAKLSVLRAEDGKTEYSVGIILAEEHTERDDGSGQLALSSDGRWIAMRARSERSRSNLILTSAPLGQSVRLAVEHFQRLRFHPRRLELAVIEVGPKPGEVELWAYDRGAWSRKERLSGAFCAQWTERGLSYAGIDGFHIVDSGREVVLIPWDFRRNPYPEWPIEAVLKLSCDWWQFSPDGAWLLFWGPDLAPPSKAYRDRRGSPPLLAVSSAPGSAPFELTATRGGLSSPRGIAFSGRRLRVLPGNGYFLEWELPNPRARREEYLGPEVKCGRNLYGQEGGSCMPNYRAALSPAGDWLMIDFTIHRP